MARPKKSLSSLPGNWQERCFSLAKVGASDSEIRVALGCISDDLWYRLLEEESEFSRTIQRCRLVSRSWWEKVARESISVRGFNTSLWAINMRNRFNWDKNDTSLTSGDRIVVNVMRYSD